MIELALAAFLRADPQVGNLTGGRVEPFRAAQGAAFPRLTYQRVSTTRVRSNDGPCHLATARIQLDCWGEGPDGYDDAKLLADKVRKARGGAAGRPVDPDRYGQLDGFRGLMNGVAVQGAFLDDDLDDGENPAFGDDRSVFRVTMDLTITFVETST